MANKHRKVWKVISRKPLSGKQTQPNKEQDLQGLRPVTTCQRPAPHLWIILYKEVLVYSYLSSLKRNDMMLHGLSFTPGIPSSNLQNTSSTKYFKLQNLQSKSRKSYYNFTERDKENRLAEKYLFQLSDKSSGSKNHFPILHRSFKQNHKQLSYIYLTTNNDIAGITRMHASFEAIYPPFENNGIKMPT